MCVLFLKPKFFFCWRQEDPGASLMDFADDSYFRSAMELGIPAMAPLHATNLWSRDVQIRKQFEGASTHQPDVFTLPRDHAVEQQSMLAPCEDLEFLLRKFQHDVGAVTGVPEEMISSQHGGHETVRKTVASGRIFSSKMEDVCRHLQDLLALVYERVYKQRNAQFVLLPMPKLEIESVQDFKALFEIGALTPDMSLQLSQILMGEDLNNKRRRVELERRSQTGGADAGVGTGGLDAQGLEVVKQAHTLPKGARGAYDAKADGDASGQKKKTGAAGGGGGAAKTPGGTKHGR